jgi:hypothetical protein
MWSYLQFSIVLVKLLILLGKLFFIIKIYSSCFLATPVTQVKDMFKKARIWFSVAYLLSMILTLVLAFTLPANLRGLVVISLIIQIISYFFYTLSYIPYGQKILGKVFKTMLE